MAGNSWKLVVSLVALFAIQPAIGGRPFEASPLDEEPQAMTQASSLINVINSHPGATWTAGLTPGISELPSSSFRVLLGSKTGDPFSPQLPRPPRLPPTLLTTPLNLPPSFDAREHWPQCSSLTYIRDQGHCGSCWAFGAVEALSDRFCIHGNENVTLAANDVLACCGFECGDGCNGGYPERAFEYFQRKGVVTIQCDPYFDPIGCKHPGCSPVMPTPACIEECVNDETWGTCKHFGLNVYSVGPNVTDIQTELYTNGPIEVAFTVYQDFAVYKSGVYKHLYGDPLGGHAVKLIGWGTTDDGVDYWLIANSWNRSWGENGYFRIIRGVNECGIETWPVTGMPLVKTPFGGKAETATE